MQMRKALIIGTIFFSMTALSIGSFAITDSNQKSVVKVHAKTLKYSDIEELYKEADIIVKGKVEKSLKTETINMNNNEDNDGDVDNVYFTNKVLRLQKVYKGEGIKPGEEILIRTLDGETEDAIVESEFTVGKDKDYVLFLKLSTFPIKDGAYDVLGTSQGSFEVKDGMKVTQQKKHEQFSEIKTLKDLEKEIEKLFQN